MKVDALAAFAYIFGPFSGEHNIVTTLLAVIEFSPSFSGTHIRNSQRLRAVPWCVEDCFYTVFPIVHFCKISVSICFAVNTIGSNPHIGFLTRVSFLAAHTLHLRAHHTTGVHDVRMLAVCRSLWAEMISSWRAFTDAARHGLARFHLPGIGPLADRWVSEE